MPRRMESLELSVAPAQRIEEAACVGVRFPPDGECETRRETSSEP
jgi:hypothetical protein